MKKRIITSIDVGTTKICTCIGEITDDGVNVVGVGITPSKGMHKGLVVNINDAKQTIVESVRKAEQASGYRVDSAYVGVTGRHITSTNNRDVVSITRSDKLVRPDDLKRVLQGAHTIKLPGDRKVLHVIPRGYTVDGQEGVKNPVGMHGFRLDAETHVITAAAGSIQNLAKCIRGAGIDIEDLVLEPLASSEAILTPDEKQAGVILADIGGGTTDVAIFRDGSIWHTAILPVAGYQLTRDVAIGLGLPFDVAEEMKKRYGSVSTACDIRSREDALSISADGHGVSYQDLCEIIRARIEEILKLIILEMPQGDYKKLVPAGLVLTGGSSNLAGLDILAQEKMHLPVRIGVPQGISGLADNLYDPAHATGVGLLLWGARRSASPQNWQTSRFSANISNITKLVSKFRSLFTKKS